jgi:tRNA(Ile)-lysidine synthetase-like protein
VWLCHAILTSFDTIVIGHFHHHLRGAEADQDEAFVSSLAAELGLPFRRGDWKRPSRETLERPDRNLQAAARKARYEFLTSVAREMDLPVIATAHQRDDQTETILLNLERGGRSGAWMGIREVLRRGGSSIIRPLLSFSKEELEGYLLHHHHAYRVDSSNRSTKYRRNQIRREVIPAIQEEEPGRIAQLLVKHEQVLSEEQEWLGLLDRIRSAGVRMGNGWMLPREPFDRMSEDGRFFCVRELGREMIQVEGWFPVRRQSFNQLNQMLIAGEKGSVNFPKGIRVELREKVIVLSAQTGGSSLTPRSMDR